MMHGFVPQTAEYFEYPNRDMVFVTMRLMVPESTLDVFQNTYQELTDGNWQKRGDIPDFLQEQLRSGAFLEDGDDGTAAIVKNNDNASGDGICNQEEHHSYKSGICVGIKRIEYFYNRKNGKPALPTDEKYYAADGVQYADRYPCIMGRAKGRIAHAYAVRPDNGMILALPEDALDALNALQADNKPLILPRPAPL